MVMPQPLAKYMWREQRSYELQVGRLESMAWVCGPWCSPPYWTWHTRPCTLPPQSLRHAPPLMHLIRRRRADIRLCAPIARAAQLSQIVVACHKHVASCPQKFPKHTQNVYTLSNSTILILVLGDQIGPLNASKMPLMFM